MNSKPKRITVEIPSFTIDVPVDEAGDNLYYYISEKLGDMLRKEVTSALTGTVRKKIKSIVAAEVKAAVTDDKKLREEAKRRVNEALKRI